MFNIKSASGYLAHHPKVNPHTNNDVCHYWTWRKDIALSFNTAEEASVYGDQHCDHFKVAT